MNLFGIPLKPEISIKGLQGGGFRLPLAIASFSAGRYGWASLGIVGVVLFLLLHGRGL